MVGSKFDDDRLVTIDDGGVGCFGGAATAEPLSPDPSSSVSCSICLDAVLYDGQRSWAKLKCGHEFHLDCIGSAFNVKGAMQCPNCRKIEKGRWLYANEVAHSVPEYSVNDWIPDQEPYELAFPELPFRVHWCPFSGLTRYRSMLEDLDASSAMYQGLPEHGPFTEHTAASTVSHSYVTYIGQPPPSNSDSLEEPVFNHHWNVAAPSDIPVPHGFPTMDFQYQNWIHRPLSNSGHIDGMDQISNPTPVMRSARDESVTRSASSIHAVLLGQGSGARAGGPFLPSVVQLPPSRSHERIIQVPPPVFQQSSTAPVIPPPVQRNRRYFVGRRPSVVPAATSHSDHNGSYFVMHPSASQNPHEALHPVPSQMYPWDRFPTSAHDSMDLNWPSLHQATGRSESGGNRSSSVWQRHWS